MYSNNAVALLQASADKAGTMEAALLVVADSIDGKPWLLAKLTPNMTARLMGRGCRGFEGAALSRTSGQPCYDTALYEVESPGFWHWDRIGSTWEAYLKWKTKGFPKKEALLAWSQSPSCTKVMKWLFYL